MVKLCNDTIIKSAEDKRLYRGLQFNNDLKVMLISDPSTDKAAASLDVNIGYLSDPAELPGLAHFCEHMLFLGTEKFPCENEYSKYLSEHGGTCNACTGADHTNYFFDIVPEHLPGALDRFSQFFLAPLFTESATEREVCAVDSEHEKNIPNDAWRLHQLEQSTAKPDHAYSKFGTGNKKTLDIDPKSKGIDTRDSLLKFHASWYSSNIMSLAILGKENLDELQEMAEEMFTGVKNKNVETPEWPDHPFGPEQLQMRGFVVPVKDLRSLNVTFPIPDMRNYYKSAPDRYLSHLLGHEGPGSLLSALKSRGWSSHLEAGARTGARGFGFFSVTVDLTEEGIEHTDDIVDLIFQYINMLKREGPKEWIFKEYTDIMAMHFRFKDKEVPRNYVYSIVNNMQDYPLEEVLCGAYLIRDWQPDLITKVLGYLTPHNCRVGIVAQKFASIADSVEPWYGTKFKMEAIEPATLKRWEQTHPCDELKLPGRNEFLPTDFSLLPREENPTVHPSIVHDTALSRVWFKQDDEFHLPKANLSFELVSPLAYLDPLRSDMTYLYVLLVKDALTEYAYDAELAGMKWELSSTKYGLILTIGGYNNKQHVLLEKIVDKLTNIKIDPKRFDILKENYVRGLKNFKAEQPYQHAMYYGAVLLAEQAWTKDELLEATDHLTLAKLEAFIPQLLSMVHIESLIHGNVNKKRTLELAQLVEDKLTAASVLPLLPPHLLRSRELRLEDGCNYIYEVTNDTHSSSCAELYFQCPMQSTQSNILVELFVQIVSEPCFNVLRTKEQLGYIVVMGVRRGHSIQGVRVIVQSQRHPTYIDQRIESFLASMKSYLQELGDAEFERHKQALAAQRLEKPKKLSARTARYWAEINSQQYNFERDLIEVAFLRSVTKQDLITFYQDLVCVDAEHRHKLAVHVVSTAEGGAGCPNKVPAETEVESTEAEKPIEHFQVIPTYSPASVIEDITRFKSSQGYFPLVQPCINVRPKGSRAKL